MMVRTMREQYANLKSQYPETVLLFFRGAYYEAIEEVAETLSRVLGLTPVRLDGVKITGFPASHYEENLGKLVRAGFRVAAIEST